MSDYIKREDALDIILKYFPRSAKKLNIYREINNLPAADVAEVRHGRLISTGYDEQYCEFGDCTVCGADNLIHNKFCGHCGARMNEEDVHETD